MAGRVKSALVTGCSPGGAGHALALELKKRGLRVFATGRTVGKIAELKEYGIECVALEVNDTASVAACHAEVSRLLGGKGLDYLYNNAGVFYNRPATESDLDQCKSMFSANVFGVMDMCQVFLPELLTAKGTIVNVGSVVGFIPFPFMSNYSASKAALQAYSEVLRLELAPLGVNVTYVQTGSIKTNIISAPYPMKEDSLWYPVKQTFEEREAHSAKTGTPPSMFAKQLADATLPGTKGTVWVGEGAGMVRIVTAVGNLLPFKLWPFLCNRMYGMNRCNVNRK